MAFIFRWQIFGKIIRVFSLSCSIRPIICSVTRNNCMTCPNDSVKMSCFPAATPPIPSSLSRLIFNYPALHHRASSGIRNSKSRNEISRTNERQHFICIFSIKAVENGGWQIFQRIFHLKISIIESDTGSCPCNGNAATGKRRHFFPIAFFFFDQRPLR